MTHLLILYPVVFLLMLYSNRKNIKSIYSIVILLYLLSSLFAVYIYRNFSTFSSSHIYLPAVIYHIIMLVLLISQFKGLSFFSHCDLVRVRNEKIIGILTALIIVLCMICNINAIQSINYSSIGEIDVLEARNALVQSSERATLFSRLAYFGNKYSLVALALFFYYLIYAPNRKLLIILLFLSSLSMVTPSLKVIGREYIIKYFFVFLIAYLICRKQLPSKTKSIIKLFSIFFAVIGIAYFIIISNLRFGDRLDYMETGTDNSMLNSLAVYYGHGFIVFSGFFEEFLIPQLPIGSIHFKFFTPFHTSAYNLNDTVFSNVFLNSFSTGVGDLMLDGGIIFATFIIILIVLLIRYVSRRQFDLFTLIYTMWFFEFIFSFLFFFNESFTGMRVLSLLIIFAFDFMNKRGGTPNRLCA